MTESQTCVECVECRQQCQTLDHAMITFLAVAICQDKFGPSEQEYTYTMRASCVIVRIVANLTKTPSGGWGMCLNTAAVEPTVLCEWCACASKQVCKKMSRCFTQHVCNAEWKHRRLSNFIGFIQGKTEQFYSASTEHHRHYMELRLAGPSSPLIYILG